MKMTKGRLKNMKCPIRKIEKLCSGCYKKFELSEKEHIGRSESKNIIFIKDAECPLCKTINHLWIEITPK